MFWCGVLGFHWEGLHWRALSDICWMGKSQSNAILKSLPQSSPWEFLELSPRKASPEETSIFFAFWKQKPSKYTRSVQKIPSHVLWKIDIYWRRHKKHCTQDNVVSVPFKVGTLGPHTVLPIAISCPVVFSWISSMVWNLFPFKGDFSFGKSQKSQGAKSGFEQGWVTWVAWCFSKNLCMTRDTWGGTLSWWSCHSPVAHSFGLLNHVNSFHGRVFKLNTKFTRYKKHCTQDNDDPVPFKVGTLGLHTVLPITITCPIVFSWISSIVWNLFPFKGNFSLGESRKSQGSKSGL